MGKEFTEKLVFSWRDFVVSLSNVYSRKDCSIFNSWRIFFLVPYFPFFSIHSHLSFPSSFDTTTKPYSTPMIQRTNISPIPKEEQITRARTEGKKTHTGIFFRGKAKGKPQKILLLGKEKGWMDEGVEGVEFFCPESSLL